MAQPDDDTLAPVISDEPAASEGSDPALVAVAARVAERVVPGGDAGPKHLVIYESILKAIEAGRWKPGDRLPPETAFVRVLPFSLGTVQRALAKLVEDGVVERRRRQGTFVAGARAEPEGLVHFHFRDAASGDLLPVYAHTISLDTTQDEGPWSAFLARTRRYIRMYRVISVNLEFSIYSELYLPYQRFRKLADHPERYLVSANFSHMLSLRFNAPTLRAIQRMRVCKVPAEVARYIGLAPGDAGMEWEIRAYTYRDKPLLMQRNWLPETDRQLEIIGPVA